MLWHVQRGHWLPVDRHHRCETWKLRPEGLSENTDGSWSLLKPNGILSFLSDGNRRFTLLNQVKSRTLTDVHRRPLRSCSKTWPLCDGQLWSQIPVDGFHVFFFPHTDQCESKLSRPRVRLQQQRCTLWRSLHWQLRLRLRLSYVHVSFIFYFNIFLFQSTDVLDVCFQVLSEDGRRNHWKRRKLQIRKNNIPSNWRHFYNRNYSLGFLPLNATLSCFFVSLLFSFSYWTMYCFPICTIFLISIPLDALLVSPLARVTTLVYHSFMNHLL